MKVDAIFIRHLDTDTESVYFYTGKSADASSSRAIDVNGPLITVTDHDGAAKIYYGLPYEAVKHEKSKT